MSQWLVFLIGVVAGVVFGLLSGRKNYESCRDQLQRTQDELESNKKKLAQTQDEIGEVERKLEEPSEDVVRVEVVDVSEHVTECPQKLARIKGVGRVYEDKLYQAGVGTFWQVATASPDELATIFGLKDFQAVDLGAIQQSARALSEETGTEGMAWNGHQPDDLERLPGIGKTYEGRLYDAGVCTWEKLAAMTPEELATIVKAPEWNQPDYEAWISYAKEQLQASA